MSPILETVKCVVFASLVAPLIYASLYVAAYGISYSARPQIFITVSVAGICVAMTFAMLAAKEFHKIIETYRERKTK